MILSKVYDPNDLELTAPLGDMHVAPLTDELRVVDAHWDNSQHVSRRWEYAMALKALREWNFQNRVTGGDGKGSYIGGGVAYDVGGYGSPFLKMLKSLRPEQHHFLIDPKANQPLDQYLWCQKTPMGHAVFCISVIEHVDDLDQFLYHLGCLVMPGGLLFLTTDYQEKPGPDDKHWHWMRKRIFDKFSMQKISHTYLRDFCYLSEQPWGTFDDRWHGPIENWGYAPASLALVKRA